MQNNLYAGFWLRALARLLDILIVSIPVLILRFSINQGLRGFGINPSEYLILNITASKIVTWLLYSVYFSVLTATAGWTPGKRILKIKVVNKEGGKVGWTDAIYRETVGRFLNEVYLLGYIVLAWTPDKTSFADLLCDTRVIKVKVEP